MKVQYIYKSAFGDYPLTITGKSATRERNSLRNLRWERAHYIERISDLNKDVQSLRKANAVMQAHARKEGERLTAEIARLHDEMEEARRDFDNALRLADIDRWKWRGIAERCFAAAMKNAVALADERKRGA